MVEGHSTRGLIIISTLYKEGRIDDDQREQLKGTQSRFCCEKRSNP